jgi:hypothetical protein
MESRTISIALAGRAVNRPRATLRALPLVSLPWATQGRRSSLCSASRRRSKKCPQSSPRSPIHSVAVRKVGVEAEAGEATGAGDAPDQTICLWVVAAVAAALEGVGECDDVADDESVDASVFDDKNIAGMGEEFWSGEGSVDVSEADDENIVEVFEERYGSEKESVVASISDCDVVELAIAPMIDCDNIGIVDSKKIIFTRSQGRVQL